MTDNLKKFFELLSNQVILSANRFGKDPASPEVSLSDPESIEAFLEKGVLAERDLFFHLHLPGGGYKGDFLKNTDVCTVRGLLFDIDAAPDLASPAAAIGAHGNGAYADKIVERRQDDCITLLKKSEYPPTACWTSGKGVHGFYLFSGGVPVDEIPDYAQLQIALAKQVGADGQLQDLRRTLRVPYGQNYKAIDFSGSGYRAVGRQLVITGALYSLKALRGWLLPNGAAVAAPSKKSPAYDHSCWPDVPCPTALTAENSYLRKLIAYGPFSTVHERPPLMTFLEAANWYSPETCVKTRQKWTSGSPSGGPDESLVIWAIVRQLLRHGNSDEEIIETLTAETTWTRQQLINKNRDPADEIQRKIVELLSEPQTVSIRSVTKDWLIAPKSTKVMFVRRSDGELFCEKSFFAMNLAKVEGIEKKRVGEWVYDRYMQYLTPLKGTVMKPFAKCALDEINLWKGFAVEPEKGNWSLMQDHILKVVCGGNDEYFKWFLNWLAWNFKNPESPGSGICLYSPKDEEGAAGAGKGIIADAIIRIMGEHGKAVVGNSKNVLKPFNSNLRSAMFVHFDEASFAGNHEVTDCIKAMVTSDTIPIEAKFQDPYDIKNVRRYFITTNHKQAIDAMRNERRWFVLKVLNDKADDPEYFTPILDQMKKGGGDAAMLYDLRNMDISTFNPHKVPKTEALEEQKQLARQREMSKVEKVLYDMIYERQLPCGELQTDGTVIVDNYPRFYEVAISQFKYDVTKREFGTALNEKFGRTDENIWRSGKTTTQYTIPSFDQCCDTWEAKTGLPVDRTRWPKGSQWRNGPDDGPF